MIADIILAGSFKRFCGFAIVSESEDPNAWSTWTQEVFRPVDAPFGPGFHRVTAESMNEHNTV